MNKPRGRLTVEEALGFTPKASDKSSVSLQFVPVDIDILSRIVTHWTKLSTEKLPVLCGITVSPAEDSRVFLNLVIDQGGAGPFLCLEAGLPRDKIIPDFSLIWPYADWWQEELSVFQNIRFDRKSPKEGVSWRRA